MSELTLLFAFAFGVLELFEVSWQKAPTLFGVLANLYHWYKKSIFFIFLLHPTFFLTVYLLLKSDFSIAMQILASLKLSDIALKLLFVKKIFIEKKSSPEISAALQMRLEPWMLYFGVVVYPILVLLGM